MDKAFERDGFVVIPQLFDEQEIARISAWTDELERCPEVPGRSMKYYEPSLLSPGERVLGIRLPFLHRDARRVDPTLRPSRRPRQRWGASIITSRR